jgi:hypothetical protein
VASKPQKGAADEVAKLVAKYGMKAVKEAEAFARRNFENKAAGMKLVPTKSMSKKARKLTESKVKESNQWHRYVEKTVNRRDTRGTVSPMPKLRKNTKADKVIKRRGK